MSDHQKYPPTGEPVDWAEKLKASMNADSEPSEPAAPIYTPEEDDLAALLRAQLERRSANAGSLSLDTSEFEDEEESPAAEDPFDDEPIDEDADGDSEDDLEDDLEDEPEDADLDDDTQDDDLPWAEDDLADEPIEEVPENESIVDDLPREDEEPAENEPVALPAVPLPINPGAFVMEESLPDSEPASAEVEDFKEELDDEFEEEFVGEPAVARVVADTALNGAQPHMPLGGCRLQELDEENTLLLRRTGLLEEREEDEAVDAASTPAMPDELQLSLEDLPLYEEESVLTSTNEDEGEADGDTLAEDESLAEPAPTVRIPYDPLQLGLDEHTARTDRAAALRHLDAECPVGTRTRSQEESTVAPVAQTAPKNATPSDYTASMPQAGGEEEAERDTALYIRLGYEAELRRAEEQARINRVREAEHGEHRPLPKNESTAASGGREYASRAQTETVENAYTRARFLAVVRLFVALSGAILALIYDVLPAVLNTDSPLAPFFSSAAYSLVDLVWLLIISLPFIPRLARGLWSLCRFEPTRYAVSGMAILVTAAHTVIAALAENASSISLFSGVALFMLAVAALSEYLTIAGEHRSFTVVSSGKPPFILTDERTPAALEATGAPSSPTLTAVRTGRLLDYFARTGRYNPYMARLNYLMPVALLAALVVGALGMLLGAEPLSDGARAFTATYLACLPTAYLISMSLPLYLASDAIAERGTAVVGTATPEYYADAGKNLVFADGDAVVALNRKEITLRGDPYTAEWRRLAAYLLLSVHSPLAEGMPVAGYDPNAIFVEVAERADHYIRFYLTDDRRPDLGTVEMILGSHEALVRRGIRLPKISMERVYKKSEDSEVVYLAIDRKFRLAFAAEYRVRRSFATTLEALRALGHTVSVQSYDPLVTQALLGDPAAEGIRLLAPPHLEGERLSRASGVVATGRPSDLVYPIAACHGMRKAYRIAACLAWSSVGVGVLVPVISMLLGEFTILSSATVMLWQVLTALSAVLVSLITVNRRTLRMTRIPTAGKDKTSRDS